MFSHGLFAILLIGIASNLDNAGVGIAYGVRKIKVSSASNLVIAIISFLATLLSGFFGKVISLVLTSNIASLIGTFVIIAVGIWVLMQPFLSKKETMDKQGILSILKNPEAADLDASQSISFSESLILGMALAMNALAGGFDAGVTGLDVWMTSLSVFILSYILLGVAAFVGSRYVADKLGDRATMIAGLLLIFVGIHQMF